VPPGDLAFKKIFLSLQSMVKRGHLNVPVIGVARSAKDVDELRARVQASFEQHGRFEPVLTRTPATLDALLRGLPDVWVASDEGRDSWSAFDIVSHLIFGERTDWMPRARMILENGESRPFDPFDRFAQFKESQDKSLEQLLDDFARLRGENLAPML
jgi:hypothetical protein